MIAYAWHRHAADAGERMSASLGLFAGHAADRERMGEHDFIRLSGPRARPRRVWRVPRSPAGWPVLLEGWLDNAATLAAELGLPPQTDSATVFGAAVERWGTGADARAIGCYAAIVGLPGDRLRLSRGPWSSRPLFYHAGADRVLVASIPRPLFAAGFPRTMRGDALDRLLRFELPDDAASLFEDIAIVPQGSVVTIGRGVPHVERWYDPLAIAPVRLPREEDYLEAAEALLGEATSAALAGAERPGVALSGGLDSALLCSEVLRQLPETRRVPTFTFEPNPEWDGVIASHRFASDRPLVEAFAAMHPRIDPHFTVNPGVGFDDRAAAMFAACDAGYPARVSGSVYHGVYQAAHDAGCDLLLLADAGNMTLSSSAPWAAREFVRTRQWRELRQLAAANLHDPRPRWRRMPQDAVMMSLPPWLADVVRAMVRRRPAGQRFANPFLTADAAARFDEGASIASTESVSREACILADYRGAGAGNEIAHSFEQVFGIRARDALAYRPLVEFCLGLPTGQLVRGGEGRRLARRLAKGRLPEAQRTNPRTGGHNVDWHVRLTPRRHELRAAAEALRDSPEMAARVDVDRLIAAIDDWPERTPADQRLAERYQFMIPAVLYVGRFIDHVTGRNPGGG